MPPMLQRRLNHTLALGIPPIWAFTSNIDSMDDLDRTQLEQVLKLSKDNNRMLHAMRRNAFLGGIFKILLWAAFIIVPFWLYMQYLAPVMQSMLNTINQVQGTGAKAQAQFSDLNDALKKLQQQFPSYFQKQQ